MPEALGDDLGVDAGLQGQGGVGIGVPGDARRVGEARSAAVGYVPRTFA